MSSSIALIGHDLFDFLNAPASLLSIVDRLHTHAVALQTSLILRESQGKTSTKTKPCYKDHDHLANIH